MNNRQPPYTPTPEEIEIGKKEIQATWTEAEEATRAGCDTGPMETEVLVSHRRGGVTFFEAQC